MLLSPETKTTQQQANQHQRPNGEANLSYSQSGTNTASYNDIFYDWIAACPETLANNSSGLTQDIIADSEINGLRRFEVDRQERVSRFDW